MKIKYSPIKSSRDTVIKFINTESIEIDGELYEFAAEDVSWPEIAEQTGGAIQEVHRDSGELHFTVLRRYTGSCAEWDTGDYHAIEG